MFKILLGLLLSFPAVATQLEMLALDEATPQIVVPQAGDSYLAPVTLQAATGNEVAFTLDYTVNKASSGNDTGLLISMTDTASPGTSLPFNIKVDGTDRFLVGIQGAPHFRANNGQTQLIGGFGHYFFGSGSISDTTQSAFFLDSSLTKFIGRSGAEIGWSSNSSNAAGTPDLLLARDAAGTLAQRNGANAQITNIYGDYASASDYQRTAIKTVRTANASVSGATVTMSSAIPAGAFLLGVTTRVDAALGETNGTTGYAVGDGSDPNLWGDVSGVAIGTDSDSADFTASGAVGFDTSARDVVLTAAGGNFDGTGDITVVVHYQITEAE